MAKAALRSAKHNRLLAALPDDALDKHDLAHLARVRDPDFDPGKSV
jgi:hypothetical protein